jgi:hypothetical protein
MVFLTRVLFFPILIAAKDTRIIELLNIKCPCHDNSSIIPPQLQGNSVLVVSNTITYPVNITINPNAAYKPFNRHRGKNKRMQTINSTSGNPHATIGATGSNTGDSSNCPLNTSKSINLAIPVYKNKQTKNSAIISTNVLLFTHENETILINKFRLGLLSLTIILSIKNVFKNTGRPSGSAYIPCMLIGNPHS